MNLFNNNLCNSVKSKYCITEQCNNKPKNNEKLCGKHLNSKNIIYFKNNLEEQIEHIDINGLNCEDEEDDDAINEKKKIYNKKELYDIISNDKYIGIYSIRNSIKNCDLHRLINTKQSKSILISKIKGIINKERYYLTNEYSVILIQSLIRRWFVHRKKICCNDTDILTFSSKYEILNVYFYIFHDSVTHKKYGYDIRTLIQIINSEYPSCPYTFRNFTEHEKMEIIKKQNILINNHITLNIEKAALSKEEEVNMKMKDVFHQINMLDNYTNYMWFKNLNIKQLIDFYIKMEDVWNYRLGMTNDAKKSIVKNGVLFNIPIHIIQYQKDIIKMQHILLDEFTRMITEGSNREDKKVGALLILTCLVEVSPDCADALPHLVQI